MSRERQIQSILTSNPEAFSEGPSNWIISRPNFELTVELSPSFPHVAPIVIVSPVIKHQWVGADGRLSNHMGVKNWNSNIQLGPLLYEIISGLTATPSAKPGQGPFVCRPPQLPVLKFSDASDPVRLAEKISALPEVAERRAVQASLVDANRRAAADLLVLKADAERQTANFNNFIGNFNSLTPSHAVALLENIANQQTALADNLTGNFGEILSRKAAFIEAREKVHRAKALKERLLFQMNLALSFCVLHKSSFSQIINKLSTNCH